MRSKVRTLTEKGKEEFGGIFPAGVPCTQIEPVTATLEGVDFPQKVFLVDWRELSSLQKDLVVEYMALKFDVPSNVVREQLDTDGHFPIAKDWIIESYEVRFFV